MTFEIVSLRSTDDGTWLALVLEGQRLGQFRFAQVGAAATDELMRSLIHTRAAGFSTSQSALDQFRALEEPRACGNRIRRVVDVTPALAAAA